MAGTRIAFFLHLVPLRTNAGSLSPKYKAISWREFGYNFGMRSGIC